MNKKNVALILALVFIVAAITYLEKGKIENGFDNGNQPLEKESSEPPEIATKNGYSLAPELTGITGYLNTEEEEELRLADLRGKVVLVDFWTYTCINCIRTLPHLVEWDQKYKDQGLVIIGVHTPEFDFEKKRENVAMAIEKYGIKYAVVQDNDYATWRAYNNRYCPRKYLIDAEGYIRYDHIGEGGYEETELKIQELLAEIGKNVSGILTIEDTTPHQQTTPELYAGYQFALPRGQNIGNEERLQPDTIIQYLFPEMPREDTIYLNGGWKSNSDSLEAVQDNSSLLLVYTAGSLNVVADSLLSLPIEVEVLLDGQYVPTGLAGNDLQFKEEKTFMVIDEPRLYNPIDGEYGQHTLELKTKKGMTINALTFG